jgi:hypothetical protein
VAAAVAHTTETISHLAMLLNQAVLEAALAEQTQQPSPAHLERLVKVTLVVLVLVQVLLGVEVAVAVVLALLV